MKNNLSNTLFLLFLCLGISTTAIAQIPKTISYQGFLTDNDQPINDGTYTIVVKIYDDPVAGNELWSESQQVNTINGLFSTVLGANTPLNLLFDQAYFVSTTFEGTELLPRTAMTASPYAFNSIQAGNPFALDNADGSATEVIYVDENSNTGIGTNLPSTNLHLRSLPGVKNELFIQPGNWDFGGDEAQITLGDFNHRITAIFGQGLNFYDVDQFRFAGSGANFEEDGLFERNLNVANKMVIGNLNTPGDEALLVDGGVQVNGNIRLADNNSIIGLDALFGFDDLRLFGAIDASGGHLAISETGNVLIGVNGGPFNYLAKLHVNGTEGRAVLLQDSELKLLGPATTHFSIFNDQAGSLRIQDASSQAQPGTPGFDLMTVSSLGDVVVSGNITAANVTAPSDRRYKKNFSAIENALDKVLQIDGLYYDWRVDEFPTKKFTNEQQIGFIAQDIELLFPEMVHTDQAGYKSVNYGRLTPVLVEAIKEQQAQIDQLKAEKVAFQAELADLKANVMARLEALETQKDNSKNSAIRTSERK